MSFRRAAFSFLLCLLALVFPAASALARPDPVTLRFQFWADIYSKPIFEGIVRDFNAAHPHIRVIPEIVPGNRYDQKMLIQVAGNTAPDVLCVEATGFVVLADKDVLRPLDEYIARTPDFHLSGYYPDSVRRFSRHGRLYALPRDTGPVCVVYYNKKLFDEAGVPYPTSDWSWSPDPDRVAKTGMDPNRDFLTVCRKLTKRDPRTGRIRQWGFTGGWDNFVYSAGGRLVDNVEEPTRITMDDPRVIDAIQFRADLTSVYHAAPSTIEIESENTTTGDLFRQGRIALVASGMWESTGFRTVTDFDWDVVKFPKGPTGLRGWGSGGTAFGIMRQCPYPEEAWEFIRYIGGKPGLTALATAGRSLPALRSVANSPVWLDNQRPLNKGPVVNDAPPYSVYSPFIIAWPRAMQVINAELDRVWTGDQTAAQAIAKSLPRAQKLMDDHRNELPRPPVRWGPVLGWIAAGFLVLAGAMAYSARRDLGPRPTRMQKRETLAGYLAVSPWLFGFIVFTTGPLAVSLVMAFCQWDAIRPAGWIGLANFREMVSGDPLVPKALWNTLVFTAIGVPLHTVGALALALLLNAGVRGVRTFRTIYYLPAVTSAVAASVLWKWVFNPDYGLLNWALERLRLMEMMAWLGLVNEKTNTVLWLTDERLAKPALIIMGLWGVGGGMIIYLAGLQGIPRSLYEAADIDGAGVLSKFRNVTLPMLTPTIFFSLIMGVIGSFQVFTQALVMTDGGPANATLFYVLYVYRAAFQDLRMGYASALAWLLFVLILLITLVQFRFSKWVYYEGGTPR